MVRCGDKIILIVLFIWSMLLTGTVYADDAAAVDISRTGIGARPLALGGAYTAVADDGNAVLMNPAGLGFFTSPKALSIRSQPQQDVYYSTYALAWPTSFGTFGFGYVETNIEDIYLAEWQNGAPVVTGKASYANNVFLMSYAKALRTDLSVGLSVKKFGQQFANLGVQDASAQGINTDLGILYKLRSNWSFGVVYQNAVTTQTLSWGNEFTEMIESHVKAGIAYQYRQAPNWFDINRVGVMLDVDVPVAQAYHVATYHLGTELWIADVFAARLGASTREAHVSGKVVSLIDPSVGIGLNLWGFEVDYTYVPGAMDLGDKGQKFYLSIAYQLPDEQLTIAENETVEPQRDQERQDDLLPDTEHNEEPVVQGDKGPVVIKQVMVSRPYYGGAEVSIKIVRKNVITVSDVLGAVKAGARTISFESEQGERSSQVRLNPGENWFVYSVNGKEYLKKIMLMKDYADMPERAQGYAEVRAMTSGGLLAGYHGNGHYAPDRAADQGEFMKVVELLQQGGYRTASNIEYKGVPISRRDAVFMLISRFGGDLEQYAAVFPKQAQNEIMEGSDGGYVTRLEMAQLLIKTSQAKERLSLLAREYDLAPYELYLTGVEED